MDRPKDQHNVTSDCKDANKAKVLALQIKQKLHVLAAQSLRKLLIPAQYPSRSKFSGI